MDANPKRLFVYKCSRNHVRLRAAEADNIRCNRCNGDETPATDAYDRLVDELAQNRLLDFADLLDAQLKTAPALARGAPMRYVGYIDKANDESDVVFKIRALRLQETLVH